MVFCYGRLSWRRHQQMDFCSLSSCLVLKPHCWSSGQWVLNSWVPCPRAISQTSSVPNDWHLETVKEMLGPWDQRITPKDEGLHPPSRAQSYHLPALVQSPKDREVKGWAGVEEATSLQPHPGYLAILIHQYSKRRAWNGPLRPRPLILLHKCHPQAQGLHQYGRRSPGHLLLSCLVGQEEHWIKSQKTWHL